MMALSEPQCNQQKDSQDRKRQHQQSKGLQCSVKVRCPVGKTHQGRDRRRGEAPKEFPKPGRQDASWFHQHSQVSARCSVCCASAEHLTSPWSFWWSAGLEVAPGSKEKARAHPWGWYRHWRLVLQGKSWANTMGLKTVQWLEARRCPLGWWNRQKTQEVTD